MIQKWIGAGLVFAGCTGAGFLKASAYRREERLLADTYRLLEQMENELSFRVSDVYILCDLSRNFSKELASFYDAVKENLLNQSADTVSDAMEIVCREGNSLPQSVYEMQFLLGQTLGQYDLEGQLREISSVKEICRQKLTALQDNREDKLKSYQTLGLCAGAALALMLL